LITKKLELPVKLVFPRNLLGGIVPGSSPGDYMMLGLGDMVCYSHCGLLVNQTL
jgi:signal peptide peptidase-like 3